MSMTKFGQKVFETLEERKVMSSNFRIGWVRREGFPEDWDVPSKANATDAGLDLKAINDEELLPGEVVYVSTGLSLELPDFIEGQIRPRSGFSTRNKVIIPNSPGTIDPGYKGVIKVALMNLGTEVVYVGKGDRIAQIVFAPITDILPIIEVKEQTDSDRGEGGFGSTGV